MQNNLKKPLVIAASFLLMTRIAAGSEDYTAVKMLPDSQPETLSYAELVKLADDPHPRGDLKRKVDKLFRTAFISNKASRGGARPHEPYDPRLGRFLRVMSWNIEKSLNLTEAITAFTDPGGYEKLIDTSRFPAHGLEYSQAQAERAFLDNVDILILQEMDWGVKRSEYRESPRELAEALHMNYAYAPAYLEIDKVNLGIEDFISNEGRHDKNLEEMIKVDAARYKGMFGSAVLSRYPIIYTEVIPLINQGYDWYESEKQRVSRLEGLRRKAAEKVFLEQLLREMKVGGRNFFRVDLYVPQIPGKRLTVINVHLEIKCQPGARELQMREILDYIKGIRNPVVLMGDFNLSATDLSPTTVKREARRLLTSPRFWFSQLLRYATPAAATLDVGTLFTNVTKNFQNPAAPNIPVVAPNKRAGMFKLIRGFRFEDGYVFDFRGNPARAVNEKRRLLANSNERDKLGFRMTFTTERTILQILGKDRLDWAFVKAYITDPVGKDEQYRMAPHFGRTLEQMNDRLRERISDHHPNIIELPFEEPPIRRD